MSQLEHKLHKEFEKAPSTKWVTAKSGRVAGEVRSAGGGGFGAGNVTFVNVYEAGCVLFSKFHVTLLTKALMDRHMVPFDQSEAALVCLPSCCCGKRRILILCLTGSDHKVDPGRVPHI